MNALLLRSILHELPARILNSPSLRKLLGMTLIVFLALTVAAVIIDYKLFPDGPSSPFYRILWGMKFMLIVFGVAGLAIMVRLRSFSLPVGAALTLYLFLFAVSMLEGNVRTGPIFAIAIAGVIGGALALSGISALRTSLLLPAFIISASIIYFFFEPEESFRFGWYSDYLGELPIGLLNGVVSHHNVFAPVMAFAIIIVIAHESTLFGRVLLVIALIGLMWSGSDGSMAATLAAVVVMVIERDLRDGRRGRAAWRAAIAFLAGLGFAVWTLLIIVRVGADEFTSGRSNLGISILTEGQDGLDKVAWTNHPHDAWLYLLLNGGPFIVGLAIAFWIVLALANYHSKPGPERTLAIGIFVFLNLHGLVEVSWGVPGINVPTALVAVMVSLVTSQKAPHKNTKF